MELKGEDEPEFEMIPDLEFGEAEQLQSQPTRDIEVTQNEPQQLEEFGKEDVVTQEPTSKKFLLRT